MVQSVNYVKTNQDKTVSIFNSFYGLEMTINGNEWDVVYSYLRGIASSEQSAENLALAVFKIAADNDFLVMDVLDQIKGQDKLQLTASLSYYLNSIRNSTTYLAIGQPIIPIRAAARNVHT